MADPATMTAIAKLGTMALGGIGMAAGAQGAHEEGTQNRADAERSGQRSRNQISRLTQGSAPMPGYTQSVQGYGMPDASGQYTQTNLPAQPAPFTDGPQQAAIEAFLPPGAGQAPAATADPELVRQYEQYLQQFQQPGAVQPGAGAPQAMTPMYQQPVTDADIYALGLSQLFGPAAPVWFDDGVTQRGQR
jgi:hypothetical protein